MKKIASTNTKAEILNAYQELLSTLKGERSNNAKLVKELEDKKQAVYNVKERIEEGAIGNIQDIRATINQQLDTLASQMDQEQEQFIQLQDAIRLEKENIEELYSIKAEAESLDALVETNKEVRNQLDHKYQLEKKQLDTELLEKKQLWKREEEGYEYNLQITRRNEGDDYNQRKEEQEKLLKQEKEAFEVDRSRREAILKEQEDELSELRNNTKQFEIRLKKKEEETAHRVEEQIGKQLEYEHKLSTKDLESEIKLLQQKVESLNSKIGNQQEQIVAYSTHSDNATKQVKDIALKAIENSGIRNLNLKGSDKGDELAR